MYRVIVRFVDLKDNNHVYHPGEVFPRDGKQVPEERIAELSGPYNKRGLPLIEAVAQQATILSVDENVASQATKNEVNEQNSAKAPEAEVAEPMPTKEKAEAPKPRARGGRKKK